MQQDDRGPMTRSQVLQRQSVHHRLVSTDHWGSLNGPLQGDRRKSLKHRPEHEGRARETVTHEHVDLLTSHVADHSYLTAIGGPEPVSVPVRRQCWPALWRARPNTGLHQGLCFINKGT